MIDALDPVSIIFSCFFALKYFQEESDAPSKPHDINMTIEKLTDAITVSGTMVQIRVSFSSIRRRQFVTPDKDTGQFLIIRCTCFTIRRSMANQSSESLWILASLQ
jgi:hypothetical protein